MINKIKFFTGALISTTLLLAGCSHEPVATPSISDNDGKLHVVATLFPQYDFVRQIAGEKVKVTKLLNPGVDVHSYEPTPSDIIMINQADLFIYTGAEMEPWAHRIIESVDNDIAVLDVSQNVSLIGWEEEHNHGSSHEEHNHDHDEDHNHDHDEDHNHDHDHDEDHNHEYDPHIWTSPLNAIIMVNSILDMLIELDPDNEAFYRANAKAYIEELEAIDASFRDVMKNANRDTIVHAGRFAVHYLMHEYGINFVAAPMEAEPSAALVAEMLTMIKEQNIPAIFHEELVDPQIARMISDETGATMLLLHSLHNVSRDELEAGITYMELMKQNMENLRYALN